MSITLTTPAEALLREQIAQGSFANIDSADEAAVQTTFGHRASKALEFLLNEALDHLGRRVPLAELRARHA
ncbi:MAG: hypothetical protein K9N47_06450 [Prosthecobacter sp.]|uniref:hypothetical protein n=1 Tax=Prosthecobacter sp. TaxID=1965333 RepID=UPI0025E00411|nr:hypothetical protein [Prosthecobacter sp.]MCF7785743.1 hypothetical protein [Prosthecobacter sp.]